MTRAGSIVVLVALLSSATTPFPAFADEGATATVDTRIVLGRFTTSYAHDAEHRGRAFNIELAAEAINGKTIAPDATFSFNDAVGERTAAFGYAKAVVIRDGMIAEGMGGGACQVASTLHAAALLSGLDVVVRAPHSRPSAYIRMGLDATVSIGGAGPAIDLKLKNPTASTITIHARAKRGTLEVWFATAGMARPDVTITSEIIERIPFERIVQRDKRIADDTVRMKSFGIPGFRLRRTREIRSSDGSVRRDVRMDLYPPTSEVVEVAPTFDEARLARRRSSEVGESEEPKDPVREILEAGAVRPVLVQVRPSRLVVLDNTAQ